MTINFLSNSLGVPYVQNHNFKIRENPVMLGTPSRVQTFIGLQIIGILTLAASKHTRGIRVHRKYPKYCTVLLETTTIWTATIAGGDRQTSKREMTTRRKHTQIVSPCTYHNIRMGIYNRLLFHIEFSLYHEKNCRCRWYFLAVYYLALFLVWCNDRC